MSSAFASPFLAPYQSLRASAGSGKTYQLTGRYLRLLQTGAPPESILATTFTRKAAGEILTRVLERLTAAALDPKAREALCVALAELAPSEQPPAELSRPQVLGLISEICQKLHRLSVTTIDGLFNAIARSFTLELGLPLQPMMTDPSHPVAGNLRAAAIAALLSEDTLRPLLLLLRQLHHDSAARSVSGAIDQIVLELFSVYRQAPDQDQWRCLNPIGRLDALELARAKADYRAVPDLPSHKSWMKYYLAGADCLAADDWQGFLGTGPAKAYAQGEESYYKQPFPPLLLDALERLVRHAIAAQQQQVLEKHLATWELLRRYEGHDQRLRRERGLVFFDDLTHKLARELPKLEQADVLLSDIYFRLDARYQHLLLDEFQDTSVDQWRVLAPMAEEITAHADGAHSLLCVGDTKQAIYGWRGGCAELFQEVEAQLHLTAGSLTRSFRSSPTVLAVVNQVFDGIAACPALQGASEAAERFEAGYEVHQAARSTLRGFVAMIPSPPISQEETGGEDASESDAFDETSDVPMTSHGHEPWVAGQVAAIHAAAPQATIGVLVSTNQAAAQLMFHLRRAGLTVSGEGGGPLTDTAGVLVILSALQLSVHPADSAAAFHLASSPLAGMLGLTPYPGEPPSVAARAEAARRLRQGLLERGLAEEIGRWVTHLTTACPPADRDRLGQLVDLADAFELEAGTSAGAADFLRYVQVQRVESPQPARIRVMTIHQAKGLEFDAVVLPELDRAFRDRATVLLERSTPTGPVERVWPAGRKDLRALHPAWEQVHTHHVQERRYGDLCALYVALTRARHALYLFPKPRKVNRSSGRLAALPPCFAAILRHQLAPDTLADLDPPGPIFVAGAADWHTDFAEPVAACGPSVPTETALPRLHFARQAPARLWRSTSPSRLTEGDPPRPADLLNLTNQNTDNSATRHGDLIHAFFEAVGWLDPTLPDMASLLTLPAIVASPITPAERAAAAEAFLALLARPSVQAALMRDGASLLWRERSFAVHLPDDAPIGSGRLLQGRFDRVHLWQEADGRFTRARLIDFKSDRCRGPEDLAHLSATYLPQITAYRLALSRMLHLPISAIEAGLLLTQPALYHPLFPSVDGASFS